ncbi:hypothetical protein RHMOL_Rhmol02G0066000 [Rhododendron molle]|uniref:Uncharacterized protein n=1 Tax=Rhododendron molle TaxID=49168 RepID=A0ACC0PNZ5_RHOML|nr:hypothetical protein RHMOL_Rhmol02G0066000 [Rhododendron molle]
MGKKVKKKARSVHKEKQPSTSSKTVAHPQQSITSTAAVDDVIKERKSCSHLDQVIDLVKVSSRLESQERIRCEDCREVVVDRRSSKGKGKQGKKKGGGSGDTKSSSKAMWVCLDCGHISCGGIGLPNTPQSHAVRHARQTRHPWAIQFENPQLRWCFQCNTLIPVETLDENGEKKDLLLGVVKLIKGQSSQGPSEDVEDGWSGSGSVASGIKSANTASASFDGKNGNVVRGLVNLGNTCFFNSIMQNLLTMDRLRDYFLELDESVGPLTVSLKKFFLEASPESGLKNSMNPRSFFGCLCAKAPQFRGYQQHDSHELLRCLLDGLCTEELSARKRTISGENGNSKTLGPTFVDAAFGGQLSSTVSCLECGHSSTVFEPFLDLSLPVPTKNPPSKRAPPVPRAKKPKLPPKRSGRIRPKTNRDADSVAEKVGDSLVGPKMVEFTGPPTVEDKKSLFSSSLSTAEDLEKKPFMEEDSLDNFSWLDYLESVPVSNDQEIASKANDFAMIYDSGQNNAVQGEASVKEIGTADSFGDLTWSDYLEPGTLPDDNAMGSNVDDVSVVQDSGSKDALPNDIFLHKELPLQVQVSEDLVFPQKEEISISGEILRGEGEVSSAVVGYEPDASDFDGFGGLFNEPEIVEGPNLKSLSIDTNTQGNEIAETGFSVANISESDPDEVDNSDSPVSIESCLALFTKPELLSNEHAWHCENCSKAVQKQRMQSRKSKQNGASEIQKRGADSRIQSAPSNSTNEDPSPNDGDIRETVFSTSNEALVSENGKIDDNQNEKKEISEEAELILSISQLKEGSSDMNDACPELSQSSSSYKTCTQASISGEASDSCSVNDPCNAGCDTGEVQQMKSQLLPKGSESERSDNEEMNSDSVKVKRDATKRILINRAPPILTIHLKRFSQDARGRLSKLNGHVVFGETIDLRPYLDPRCMGADEYKFRLIGVVEHLGTMRGGHYVAYVRAAKGNKKADKESADFVWYHASDAYVREASMEEVLRCEAYILFYEKL